MFELEIGKSLKLQYDFQVILRERSTVVDQFCGSLLFNFFPLGGSRAVAGLPSDVQKKSWGYVCTHALDSFWQS